MTHKTLFLVYLVVSISILSNLSVVDSARILALLPTPSFSHQLVFRAVTEELAARGHELVILTPNPSDDVAQLTNVKQIDVSFAYQGYFHQINFAGTKEENVPLTQLLSMFTRALSEIVDTELSHPDIQQLLNNPKEHFDAVICEFIGYTPMYAFAEYFNAPLIGITSSEPTYHEHRAAGNFIHSVLHPMNVLSFYRDLNFIQRLASTSLDLIMRLYFEPLVYGIFDEFIEQHFSSNVSRSAELARKVDMLLLNTHPALGFVRPLVPKTIQLGFLHIKPPQPLPSEWSNYMDGSKHGVIYFSLGTNVRTSNLRSGTVDMLLNAFGRLKYDVLWKWDCGDTRTKPLNVRTTSWVPQQDLLAHPKMKLFITQGGQQSIEEAIDRAVPMIVIPFFVDQLPNSQRVADKKIGIALNLNDVTEEVLIEHIIEVIENPQ